MLQNSKTRARLGLGLVCLSLGCADGGDASTAPQPTSINQEIVGGAPAPERAFPGFASLRDSDGEHFCGGTLIAPSWVLTAGHCVYPELVRGGLDEVVVGGFALSSSEGEHLKVERAYQHPDYNEDVLFPEHDVGLLRLATPSHAPVVRLAGQELLRRIHPGTLLRVVGHGNTDEDSEQTSDALLLADVPLVSRHECARVYGKFLVDSMFCAGYPQGGTDSCQGDSGGPVFANDAQGPVQLAVVTGGIGCARPEWYGLYTNVTRYGDWIANTRARGDLEAPALAPCFAGCAPDKVCGTNEPASSCSYKLESCLCKCSVEGTPLCEGNFVGGGDEGGGSGPVNVPSDGEAGPLESTVAEGG